MSNESESQTADDGGEYAGPVDARDVCGEAYQAVGFLVDRLGYWSMSADDPRQIQITKLLDNLEAASGDEPIPHMDLLPFGWDVADNE